MLLPASVDSVLIPTVKINITEIFGTKKSCLISFNICIFVCAIFQIW